MLANAFVPGLGDPAPDLYLNGKRAKPSHGEEANVMPGGNEFQVPRTKRLPRTNFRILQCSLFSAVRICLKAGACAHAVQACAELTSPEEPIEQLTERTPRQSSQGIGGQLGQLAELGRDHRGDALDHIAEELALLRVRGVPLT